MATVKAHGFTVIELMLFLGVTGALFAALMVGVNSNIGQQRYRESVVGYSSLLQQQYSDVTNTRNERDSNWKCASDGTVVQQPTGGDARGTTSCVILGKAVQIGTNGSSVQTTVVVGVEPPQQPSASELETLKAYQPKLATSFNSVTDTIDWQSHLSDTNHQASSASFLILRSPTSGLLRVFASASPLPADLTRMLTSADATTPITDCVQGETGSAPIQSVTVDPRVAGPNGVSVKEVDSTCT